MSALVVVPSKPHTPLKMTEGGGGHRGSSAQTHGGDMYGFAALAHREKSSFLGPNAHMTQSYTPTGGSMGGHANQSMYGSGNYGGHQIQSHHGAMTQNSRKVRRVHIFKV